jgi:hypothetical protein
MMSDAIEFLSLAGALIALVVYFRRRRALVSDAAVIARLTAALPARNAAASNLQPKSKRSSSCY